jgi:AmmeMemoRadiSam system protein A
MPQRGPRAAADVVIQLSSGRIVLVRRLNPPPGWAIPGGFIEEGESAEQAAVREALEETALHVELTELFHVYSDPHRDPRHHILSVVFLGRARGEPAGGDDAAEALTFDEADLPAELAFDHHRILADYFEYRRTGRRPAPALPSARRLSDNERSYLLHLARATIQAALEGKPPPSEPPPTAMLDEPTGVFVSLHRGGELRGCIGNFARDRPLQQAVRDMALAAAFDDPRFPPLTAAELDSLQVEISVLSERSPAVATTVVPGVHGVSISLHDRKAVFLPQVAREAGWSRETLLSQACLKAGLPCDAWKDPQAHISVFTAEVFGETV